MGWAGPFASLFKKNNFLILLLFLTDQFVLTRWPASPPLKWNKLHFLTHFHSPAGPARFATHNCKYLKSRRLMILLTKKKRRPMICQGTCERWVLIILQPLYWKKLNINIILLNVFHFALLKQQCGVGNDCDVALLGCHYWNFFLSISTIIRLVALFFFFLKKKIIRCVVIYFR